MLALQAERRLRGGGCSGPEAWRASSRRLRWFEEGSERVGWTAWCWSRPKPVKRRALDQAAQPRRIHSPDCDTQRHLAMSPRMPGAHTYRQLLSFGCATLGFGRRGRCGFALRFALHRVCGCLRRAQQALGLGGRECASGWSRWCAAACCQQQLNRVSIAVPSKVLAQTPTKKSHVTGNNLHGALSELRMRCLRPRIPHVSILFS